MLENSRHQSGIHRLSASANEVNNANRLLAYEETFRHWKMFLPRLRLVGNKLGVSVGQKKRVSESRGLVGACSGGKFVVSRSGEAYAAYFTGSTRKFRRNTVTRSTSRLLGVSVLLGLFFLALSFSGSVLVRIASLDFGTSEALFALSEHDLVHMMRIYLVAEVRHINSIDVSTAIHDAVQTRQRASVLSSRNNPDSPGNNGCIRQKTFIGMARPLDVSPCAWIVSTERILCHPGGRDPRDRQPDRHLVGTLCGMAERLSWPNALGCAAFPNVSIS
jgi:hypothetical protein